MCHFHANSRGWDSVAQHLGSFRHRTAHCQLITLRIFIKENQKGKEARHKSLERVSPAIPGLRTEDPNYGDRGQNHEWRGCQKGSIC